MIKNALQQIFRRDLEKLKQEIESYRSEECIWKTDKAISNSAGNLCLHLIGNLNAYIGVGLAKTNYIRNRDLEFSSPAVPRSELIEKINATIVIVEQGLNNLTADLLQGDFPLVIWDKPTGTEFTLIHLASHLNYHLGQINYHRRLLDMQEK